MKRSNWWCLAVVLIGALVVSACSSISEDTALEQKLESLERDGTHVALRDLTDFSWDKVFVFYGYAEGRHINQTVGGTVVGDNSRTGEYENLIVFVSGGTPVRKASVDDLFTAEAREEWPADVQIVPTPYCRLVLVVPGDPDPPAECFR